MENAIETAPAVALSRPKIAVLTIVSALLTVSAFPPCGFAALIWVSLVPWLYCLVRLPWRDVIFSYGLFLFCFFVPGLWWMTVVHPVCPFISLIPLFIMCLPFPLLLNWTVRMLKLPIVIAIPVLWVAGEYLRSFLFTGFPWIFLGHTQAFLPSMIQIADITGVYGVSFLVALVNGLALAWLEWYQDRPKDLPYRLRPLLPLLASTAITGLLLLSTLWYGHWRLAHLTFGIGPKIAAVQGNIPQDIKDDPRESRQKILEIYTKLSVAALANKPDLLIWPETMAPADPQLDYPTHAMLRDMAKFSGSHLLVGAHHFEPEPGPAESPEIKLYNSVYFINPQGQYLSRYDKIHLVLLGEFLPKIPFLNQIVESVVGFAPNLSFGEKRTIFELGQYRFGALICYEIVYAPEVRALAQAGCHFMVNATNEGWFSYTSELEQILQNSIFRAVENRTGIVRAGNSGITMAIGPDGRIRKDLILTLPYERYFDSLPAFLQQRIAGKSSLAWHHLPQSLWQKGTPLWAPLAKDWDVELDGQRLKWKDFPGIFCQNIPLATGETTIYTAWGDWFAQLLSIISLVWLGQIFIKTWSSHSFTATRNQQRGQP